MDPVAVLRRVYPMKRCGSPCRRLVIYLEFPRSHGSVATRSPVHHVRARLHHRSAARRGPPPLADVPVGQTATEPEARTEFIIHCSVLHCRPHHRTTPVSRNRPPPKTACDNQLMSRWPGAPVDSIGRSQQHLLLPHHEQFLLPYVTPKSHRWWESSRDSTRSRSSR